MIARLALAEGGVDYERVFVDILLRGTQHSAAYARLNPEMTVPSLVLGERVLTQSRAVVEWALGAGEGARGGEIGYWMDLAYSFAVDELTFGGLLARHAVARAVIPAAAGGGAAAVASAGGGVARFGGCLYAAGGGVCGAGAGVCAGGGGAVVCGAVWGGLRVAGPAGASVGGWAGGVGGGGV